MTTPTVAPTYTRDTGPVQRLTGNATFLTAATDAAVYPTGTGAGDIVSTLASGVLTLQLGFVPTYWRVVNVTTRIMSEWFAPMAGTASIDTAANGDRSLNASAPQVVTVRTGLGGLAGTRSGGSADTTPAGQVVLTLSGFATDGDSIVWLAEG